MDVTDLATLSGAPEAEATTPEPLFDPEPTPDAAPALVADGEEGEPEAVEAAEGEEVEGEPEAEPEGPVVAPDDALIKIGDEEISVADMRERWKRSGMMQADYTRKTQELAQQRHEFEGTKAEVQAWLQNMHDPELLEAQCMELFPDAFEKAVERRAQEMLVLADRSADERAKDLVQRERRLRIEQGTLKSQGARDKAVTEVEAKRREAAENAAKTAQLRDQFVAWNGDAMKSAGLDAANRDHAQLVVGMLRSSVPAGVELTADHFREAAKRVASAIGAKPPAAPKTRVAAPAAKLPPSTGGKATSRQAPASERRPGAGNGRPKRSMADFMNDIMTGKM